jgi:hypothetical protein
VLQSAKTVPATVAYSPVARVRDGDRDVPDGASGVVDAEAVGAEVVDAEIVDAEVVEVTGEVPGVAEASTRDTAKKPRPTAATADADQAAPSATDRFMPRRVQPNGLRAPQERVKACPGSSGGVRAGVSVAGWPSSWWWRTTSGSALP